MASRVQLGVEILPLSSPSAGQSSPSALIWAGAHDPVELFKWILGTQTSGPYACVASTLLTEPSP